MDKAPALPSDCQWHFIGHLQSNKARALLEAVPNLALLETVDSQRLASKLDSTGGWRDAGHIEQCFCVCGAHHRPECITRVTSAHVYTPPSPLAAAVAALGRPALPVFVQVNTSGEASKYGVEPADCVALARHIAEGCPHLRFAGLMTIGMPGEGALY